MFRALSYGTRTILIIHNSQFRIKHFVLLVIVIVNVIVAAELQTQLIKRLVSSRSVKSIRTLLTTTELVPALPTSMLPPRTV